MQQMRASSYLIVAPLAGDRFSLLLHGLTGAFDKVSRDVADRLLSVRGSEVDPLSLGLQPEIVEQLLARGYLTLSTAEEEQSNLREISARLRELDLQRKIPSFSFVPTYQCNLRCPYCFQSHDQHAGIGAFSRVLSEAQIDQAFSIIDNYWRPGAVAEAAGLLAENRVAEPRDKWSLSEIGLFGGEPLMSATSGAIGLISERARSRGLRLWGITNGVALHEFETMLGTGAGDIAELQITVDGMPHHHNKRRRGLELVGTFDRILDNIAMALERGVQINIRMNTDRSNVDDITDLGEIFTQRGFTGRSNFEFYCAVVTRPDGPPLLDRYALVGRTLAAAASGTQVASYEQSARTLLQRLLSGGESALYPFSGSAHCAAESGQIMFDCMGDVYGCWEDVGDSRHRIGTYGPEGLNLDDATVAHWLNRHPGAIEACSKCPYALIHTSGCGSQARVRSGSIYTNECESFQQYFPLALADTYSEIERRLLAADDLHVPVKTAGKVPPDATARTIPIAT